LDPYENPWKTLSTRNIFTNDFLSLREDIVIRPDGAEGTYSVVDTRIATGVVALTPANEIYLVGQYRYTTDIYSWEIPEGGTDPGEAPLAAIQRELREEAGVVARSWEPLGGELHLSNCITSERGYLFLATDLEEVGNNPDGTEQLEVKKLPFSEALAMVDSGEIVDAFSIIAILRAARRLDQ
jgi:8-oxo-dGTP pyrophosphatase MutT (NUDIX family)